MGISLFALPFFGGEIFGFGVLASAIGLPSMGLFMAIVAVNIVFYHLLKAPTLAGRRLMDDIEGLNLYLGVAEKDRLNLLNPPDRTPAHFEALLPLRHGPRRGERLERPVCRCVGQGGRGCNDGAPSHPVLVQRSHALQRTGRQPGRPLRRCGFGFIQCAGIVIRQRRRRIVRWGRGRRRRRRVVGGDVFYSGGKIMEKKVLIAVDDSRHSENALRYVARVYETVEKMKIVLFHVEPTISQYLVDEARTKSSAYAELQKLMHSSHQAARVLLEKDKSLMVSSGVAEKDIQVMSLPRKFGAAKDILEYGTALLYDAIIVGRRGLSGLAEVFVGSVSANIVDNSQLLPIWLVDEKTDARGIMVAVDGSESSLRAVDHLSFIFGGNPDLTISFFHVAPRLSDFCSIDFAETDTSALEAVIKQGDKRL